jgi:hypothetical protein
VCVWGGGGSQSRGLAAAVHVSSRYNAPALIRIVKSL